MTKTKENYSSYWLDDTQYTDATDSTESKVNGIERIVKLSSTRRAIANFVRILTNDSKIAVRFSSGKNSYTDGKTVVISADDKSGNFDPMVGLALHEGSHCLLSDFTFLRNILVPATNLSYTAKFESFHKALHPTLAKRFPMLADTTDFQTVDKFDADMKQLMEYLRTLMNVIEDRRIDSYVYRMAPGYRPYYDAMYEKYFFSKDIKQNLLNNPEWRTPTVDNYINWLLFIFSPHFTPKALPGLSKMVKMIDLKNIRRFDEPHMPESMLDWSTYTDANGHHRYVYEELPLLWRVSNELLIEILRYVDFYSKNENKSSHPMMEDMDGEDMDDLENLDLAPPGTGRFNPKKGSSSAEKIRKAMNGEIKKKKIKKSDLVQVESMEDASAKIEETSDPVFGKTPCLVTRKLTKEVLLSDWFPFTRSARWHWKSDDNRLLEVTDAREGVIAGIRMGQILAHRLQLRNDSSITHFTRQPHGKIDRRILAQLGMDIEQVFKRTTVENYHPTLLYLSLDGSGSMGGAKWKQAMTVATALAYAADKIRNLDVVVTVRGDADIPVIAVVYDSRVDTFRKVQQLFPYLSTSGSTPEGLCYAATMDLIQECTATHTTYFINFSDGEPGCSFKYNGRYIGYSGHNAAEHTKRMVARIREAGIKIMSYFITDRIDGYRQYAHNMFSQMYGQDAEFVNVRNVTHVLKTLNKLLLVK